MTAPCPTRIDPAHLPSIAALEQLCFAEPWSESSLAMLCREGGTGVVIPAAAGQATALAYGGMTYVIGVEGSITNVATHPNARRKGLGRAIVAALIEQGRILGLVDIYLEVRISNQAAIALYRSFGFQTVGTRKGFYRLPTEDALLMRLTLDQSKR